MGGSNQYQKAVIQLYHKGEKLNLPAQKNLKHQFLAEFSFRWLRNLRSVGNNYCLATESIWFM